MRKIPLTQGKVALVDNQDYDWLNQQKWCILQTPYIDHFYAYRSIFTSKGQKKTLLMHRLILGLDFSDGKQVDHIDGNGLNNQQSNLRICSQRQNSQNARKRNMKATSKYKGVHWCRRDSKWVARIVVDSKIVFLGHFSSEFAGAQAYNKAALKHFGEFAKLNEITTRKLSRVERIGWQSI